MTATRRDFLKVSLGATTMASFGSAVPDFLLRSAAGASGDGERVLVVVQLSGGNDGLNTVVPYEDDEYGRHRTTLRLPRRELHRIGQDLGLHPRMGACKELFDEGRLAIVQGVGYPDEDRGHPGAMRVWHTGDPDRRDRQTGWVGRVADRHAASEGADGPAAFVGSIPTPHALNAGRAHVTAVRSPRDLVLQPTTGRSPWERTAEPDRSEADNPFLALVQRASLRACAHSQRIEEVSGSSRGAGEYPPFQLAGDLRTIAQLIRAELGIRVFFVELGGGGIGGFDNHANQLGNHCALLHHLSESLGAFLADLQRDRLSDRVLLMTFSEFGRTLAENGRRGTGHGAAAPVLLAGGRLRGGLVGQHPSLTDLDEGAPRFCIDFRRVYATVLDRWLGFESRAVLGGSFEPLDVLGV